MRQRDKFVMVGLGEVLWDGFYAQGHPVRRVPGGAPANFAYYCAALGDEGIIASRVGNDGPGDELRSFFEAHGVVAEFIQSDASHETGAVTVSADALGQPEYVIRSDVAWDCLEWTSEWRGLAARADAVCFGSLAQRSFASRRVIRTFLQSLRSEALRLFDVNLRLNHFDQETLAESFSFAHIAKLNRDEACVIFDMFGISAAGLVEGAQSFRELFDLRLLCITRGDEGGLLISADEIADHVGYASSVVDAVGAGDAFTAAIAHHAVRTSSLKAMNEAGNRLGSWVVSQPGAITTLPPEIARAVIEIS